MKLRTYLVLVTVVGLLPGLIAASFAVKTLRDSQREAELHGLKETVRATSLLVDREMAEALGTLNARF